MATTVTPWVGGEADKLYLTSGQFTSTIKDSESIVGIDMNPEGISWDGTNTPWSGSEADKLYLQSGQFTSTLKTSLAPGLDTILTGISWDGEDTPWAGRFDDKLYLQSGQFTSTLKTSQSTISFDTDVIEISWDGTNTPWMGFGGDKMFLTSGQFSSTLKTSLLITSVDNLPTGISWDGVNTPWCGAEAGKLYLQSGQFSSTVKTSQSIVGVDNDPVGICTDDWIARIDAKQYYFGGLTTFDELTLIIGTAGVGSYVLVWEYWDGSEWVALSTTQADDFKTTGCQFVRFEKPNDWATTIINGQGPYYYIRTRWTSGTMTTAPRGDTASMTVTKYRNFELKGQTITSSGLSIPAAWVEDTNG